jgi:hypothetical protein
MLTRKRKVSMKLMKTYAFVQELTLLLPQRQSRHKVFHHHYLHLHHVRRPHYLPHLLLQLDQLHPRDDDDQ